MLKFHEQLYVGIKDNGLGFATPEGSDAAAKKRKSTVDHWLRGYGGRNADASNTKTIDNVPMTGFSLGDAQSRWSTDNKWFRLYDPRGFMLEISAYNLADLIAECTIVKGKFEDELVWMRDLQKNVLVKSDHVDYLERNRGGFDPKPGDIFKNRNRNDGGLYIYHGRKWMTLIEERRHVQRQWPHPPVMEYSYLSGIDAKAVHVYGEVWKTGTTNWSSDLIVRRGKFNKKDLVEFDGDGYTVGQIIDDWQRVSSNMSTYRTLSKLFDTKEEAKAAIIPEDEVRAIFEEKQRLAKIEEEARLAEFRSRHAK